MSKSYLHPWANKRNATTFFLVLLLCLFYGLTNKAYSQSRGVAVEPAAPHASVPFHKGTYRALLIGNNSYSDNQGVWPPLKTAVSDARAIRNILRQQYGFTDVQILENATRRDVLFALQDLSRRVMAKDNVLLYYAGHGFMDMDTNKGYWVPTDAQGRDHTTYLRNSTIRDELTVIASRAKHTLLISDSCFSGSLLRRGTRGIVPEANTERYYQKVAAKKSVQIITAGGMEYVDDDYKQSGHSPFTYFLLNELKHNDKKLLTVSELSTNVEKAVANNVDQVPESGVLQGAGDELGEFIFINVDVHTKGIPRDKIKVKVNVIPEQNVEAIGAEPKTRPSPPDEPAPQKQQQERFIMPLPTL
jgi:hypothetical protein